MPARPFRPKAKERTVAHPGDDHRPTVALCGAGAASVLHGLAARHLGVPVVAVAGRSALRTAERAREFGAAAVAVEALPAGADIVLVATPPACHAEHTLRAVAGGARAVAVTAPLCSTLADADRLVGAADHAVLVYAEPLLHAPLVQRFADLAAGVGPLSYVEARAVQPAPTWSDAGSAAWGGGALFDLGVHPLAVLLAALGPDLPVAVSATVTPGGVSRPGDPVGGVSRPGDTAATVRLRTAAGVTGVLRVAWQDGAVPQWDAQVAGERGVIRVELAPTPGLERDGVAVPVAVPASTPEQLAGFGWVGQLRRLVADLPLGRSAVPVAVGRQVLDVLCAAYASAGRSGAEEALPFTGPRTATPLELWRGGPC